MSKKLYPLCIPRQNLLRVRSGARDGQVIGPLFPFHFAGNIVSKCYLTSAILRKK